MPRNKPTPRLRSCGAFSTTSVGLPVSVKESYDILERTKHGMNYEWDWYNWYFDLFFSMRDSK